MLHSLLSLGVSAATPSRVALDQGWHFARFGTMPDGSTEPEPFGLETAAVDDSWWRVVQVPHDWGIEGPFRADLPGSTGRLPWAGIGWYRRLITLPVSEAGLRSYLEFDAAMSHAKIYVNGQLAGEWHYGYSSFRVDITPFLKPGAQNLLAIRLENLPDSSRWYPGGGLIRKVYLTRLNPLQISHWGVSVRTPEVSAQKATLDISTDIENRQATAAKLLVRHELRQRGQTRPLVSVETPVSELAPDDTKTLHAHLELQHPELWSVSDPHLYELHTVLMTAAHQVVETQVTTVGLRKAVFTADNGFLLNGQRIQIHGVCEHHDLGPLGAAFNTAAMERKLKILKEMGVNALRTSHNPPAPEVLDLCDRLGILVMDEAFDCWHEHKTKNDYSRWFDAWFERDIENWVKRDRNHPSVIMWSIGNEIVEQHRPEGLDLAVRLRETVRRYDTSRPVVMGLNQADSVKNGFYKGADIIGLNYKPHLYAEDHSLAPGFPILGSETSSTVSTRGVYVFPVSNERESGFGTFQVSSYDLYYPRWAQTPDMEWEAQDKNRFVVGEFVWTGFDYLGEPTPFNDDRTNLLNYQNEDEKKKALAELERLGGHVPSRSSYFGIIDLCGFPKDRYYLYQARWRPELPMAHILPHWTWLGREGKVTPVFVYTSGDEAELFVNDKSMGRKKRGPYEYRLRWDNVVYHPGSVRVVAYKNGRVWAKDEVHTSGAPAKIEVTTDKESIDGDGEDLMYVQVRVLDSEGNFVPDAFNGITFSVAGNVEVIAVCNGDPTSFEPFQATTISAFNGMAQAIIRAKRGASAEKFTIDVRCNGAGDKEIQRRIDR